MVVDGGREGKRLGRFRGCWGLDRTKTKQETTKLGKPKKVRKETFHCNTRVNGFKRVQTAL